MFKHKQRGRITRAPERADSKLFSFKFGNMRDALAHDDPAQALPMKMTSLMSIEVGDATRSLQQYSGSAIKWEVQPTRPNGKSELSQLSMAFYRNCILINNMVEGRQ